MFEKTKLYLKMHSNEFIIVGVMAALSVGIAVAAGGDIGEALARRGR